MLDDKLAPLADEIAKDFAAQFIPLRNELTKLQATVERQSDQITELRIENAKMLQPSAAKTSVPGLVPAASTQDESSGTAQVSEPAQNPILATPAYLRFKKFYDENQLDVAAMAFDPMKRDFASVQYKAGHQSADDPFTFIMSTETEDRMGDVIVAAGWDLREFKKNPIGLYQHNSMNPIGTWKNVKIDRKNKRLLGTLQMAKKGTSPIVDQARSLLEQKILKTVSVGFSVTKYDPIEDEDGNRTGGYKFLKSILLECSVVSIPANSEALMVQE